MDKINANTSDIGTANHKPFISNIIGKIIIVPTKNIKVLEKAIIADILPFDNAVNNILEKVLNPTNKSAKENSLFPLTANS